ncbi:hypothetical protein ACGTN9_17525 [Halobacillus sp. MO56]
MREAKVIKKVNGLTSSQDILRDAKELERSIDVTLRETKSRNSISNNQEHEKFLARLKEMEQALMHS